MQQRSDPGSWIEINEGDIPLSVDCFPDGSFRFTCEFNETKATNFLVTLKSTLPEAIIALHQVCTAIVAKYDNTRNVNVLVQTMPDQRADRIEKDGMTNAALVSARLLGFTPCRNIIICDPHSYVCTTVLKQVCEAQGVGLEVLEAVDCFIETLYDDCNNHHKVDVVVAVDKGAIHRAEDVSNHFGASIIFADKKRVDGQVVGHEIINQTDYVREDEVIWVVDDLCDGGATFISIAKLIKERYPNNELNLYVTHGLFSKGKEELSKYFTHILAMHDYSGA